jgi:hypothetical protein
MAKERGWLPSLGHAPLGTFPINGSRPQDYPRRWASSRVHCIGWFDNYRDTFLRSYVGHSRVLFGEDAVQMGKRV